MTFDPKVYRNNKDGIGGPGDDLALNTTDPNTMVALLKGIFGKLGGGTTTALATDKAQGSATSGQLGELVQGAARPIRSASKSTGICASPTPTLPRC
jgi:hypothetical protein